MPRTWIVTICEYPGCGATVKTANGNRLCIKHRKKLNYRKHNAHDMKRANVSGCHDCKFLKDCRHEIWRPTFSPFCFVESRHHGQFVKAYGLKALEAQA